VRALDLPAAHAERIETLVFDAALEQLGPKS
jgi:hypothetical protein